MKYATQQFKTIVFTGGGSGGHVLPIASLLEYAQHNTQIIDKCKALYRFGEKGSLEEEKSGMFDGVGFVPIMSGKLRRYVTLSSVILTIRDFFRVLGGFFQCLRYLKKYKADVVFCKGGYVTIPVCLAAKILRIPVVVHESDTHMGLANRFAAKMATKVFTGFDGVFYKSFTVGQVLSLSLSTPQPVELEGFDTTKPTILCIGGSQGADALFQLVPRLVEQFGQEQQYIVITGLKNAHRQQKLEQYDNVFAVGFVGQQEIARLMEQSDYSITRGGATSLQEQHLFGIKKCIVPLPFTGGNHQEINADQYVEKYGDTKVLQNDNLYKHVALFIELNAWEKKQQTDIDMDGLLYAHEQIWAELLK